MTRARALKSVIRTRVARTGERYTTARRHVLAVREAAAARSATPTAPAVSAAPPQASAVPHEKAMTKGVVRDAAVLARTGRGLEAWLDVLDRFDAARRGHTAAARHLETEHGVDRWYAQAITVAHERARGLRAKYQRRDGRFEVNVSKTVDAAPAQVVAAFSEPRRRARWLGGVLPAAAKALASALEAPKSKEFAVKPNGRAQYRYGWGDTAVQLYVESRPKGRAAVVVAHGKLPSAEWVETRRAEWRAALDALAAYLK